MRFFFATAMFAAVIALTFTPALADPVHGIAMHGIAMHGAPKYGPDFKHFDYVNPDAPKGGEVRLNAMGTFDSLNGFIIKGQPASGITLIYDTLMGDSPDEAFSEYGRLAETVTMPTDRSWVIFTLRKEARWQDGKPVTQDDVIFSLETLKTKGAPFYRVYFGDVIKAERVGERGIRFTFKSGENRELPLIVGQMPILPKRYWAGKDFEATTLEPPLGSGPYRIDSFEPGRYIVYKRDPAYWGRDLPVNRGTYNFDRIRYDYYRDATVALEGFKAGAYDFREENVSKQWATAYDFPAVADGRVKKEELHNQNSTGMQAFIFNIRRPLFKDSKVRQALAYAFDFEWSNKTLFYGQYVRTESFFANSELASRSLPSPEELKILEPLRDKIPDEVFTKEYKAPATDGTGNPRENMRIASALLKEAGWVVKDRQLVDGKTGAPFEFEILLYDPTFERLSLPFARNLERLGIKASVRTVDSAQYKNRLDSFDFDMVISSWGASMSPGNEQRNQWGSVAADTKGSSNHIGIKDPAVDRLVDLVISAPDRESLIVRTRALDRVLLWGHYLIPNWHITYDRVAYWSKLRRPEMVPVRGYQFLSWWIDPGK